MSMGRFRIKIYDRLSLDNEDAKKSKEIISQLGILGKELPDIQKHEEATREKYWLCYEEMRKANVLSYSETRKKEIQTRMWRAESEISAPRKALGKKTEALQFQLQSLIDPLKKEIIMWIEKYLDEVTTLPSARVVERKRKLLDLGDKGERDVSLRIAEDNFNAVEKVKKLLVDFKFKIRNVTKVSLDEILQLVKVFEDEANGIDITRTEKREISESQFQEMRAEGLI
jgi:hypothetical protein